MSFHACRIRCKHFVCIINETVNIMKYSPSKTILTLLNPTKRHQNFVPGTKE